MSFSNNRIKDSLFKYKKKKEAAETERRRKERKKKSISILPSIVNVTERKENQKNLNLAIKRKVIGDL
jgi:hypothetical protein